MRARNYGVCGLVVIGLGVVFGREHNTYQVLTLGMLLVIAGLLAEIADKEAK